MANLYKNCKNLGILVVKFQKMKLGTACQLNVANPHLGHSGQIIPNEKLAKPVECMNIIQLNNVHI